MSLDGYALEISIQLELISNELKTHNDLLREGLRPSVVYKAQLMQLNDGHWQAFIPQTGIYGLGATPDAALRAFDKTFNGG